MKTKPKTKTKTNTGNVWRCEPSVPISDDALKNNPGATWAKGRIERAYRAQKITGSRNATGLAMSSRD